MKTVIIIPARNASSRFPGKPLMDIKGKSLVRRTWGRCRLALEEKNIYVATDDSRIADHCAEQGILHIMTSADCLTGTDRVKEASDQINADIYLDVQGDEPLINPDDIVTVMQAAIFRWKRAFISASPANPGTATKLLSLVSWKTAKRRLNGGSIRFLIKK
jgi:3-deoxy-manno-octulosonate cytidylyltransferase (CMP-KDO synthetase)